MVIDLKKLSRRAGTSDQEKLPKAPAPVVWEVHVGDFSHDPHSGVSEENRGKYKSVLRKAIPVWMEIQETRRA